MANSTSHDPSKLSAAERPATPNAPAPPAIGGAQLTVAVAQGQAALAALKAKVDASPEHSEALEAVKNGLAHLWERVIIPSLAEAMPQIIAFLTRTLLSRLGDKPR